MRYHELLEIAFTPVPHDWDDKKTINYGTIKTIARFVVDKIPYIVRFEKLSGFNYDVDFDVDRKNVKGPIDQQPFKLTGTGNTATVLGTVINIIEDFLNYEMPDGLHWVAEGESRIRFYNALEKRMQSRIEYMGYKLTKKTGKYGTTPHVEYSLQAISYED